MQYLVKSKAAQAICKQRWGGQVKWPKADLCADCPLLCKCGSPPAVPGIAAYTIWMAAVNAEAAKLEPDLSNFDEVVNKERSEG